MYLLKKKETKLYFPPCMCITKSFKPIMSLSVEGEENNLHPFACHCHPLERVNIIM